jgi:hypothetical protein
VSRRRRAPQHPHNAELEALLEQATERANAAGVPVMLLAEDGTAVTAYPDPWRKREAGLSS